MAKRKAPSVPTIPKKRVRSFSTKIEPSAYTPFAKGGNIAIRVKSKAEAVKLIERYHFKLNFWQVSKVWRISRQQGQSVDVEGFSPIAIPAKGKPKRHAVMRNRTKTTYPTPAAIEVMLEDSAQGAVNKLGNTRSEYEGTKPKGVSPILMKKKVKVTSKRPKEQSGYFGSGSGPTPQKPRYKDVLVQDPTFFVVLWFDGNHAKTFNEAKEQ